MNASLFDQAKEFAIKFIHKQLENTQVYPHICTLEYDFYSVKDVIS